MGLRDWFTSSSNKANSEEEETEETMPNQDEEAFAALQDMKTAEALSLFEEDEPQEVPANVLEAPYDASDASVDDLLEEREESFTHHDEVSIADVNELEDPYLAARIEGDVPEAVVFEDDGNSPVV
ncbi:MAG: hypothetical protein ACO2Y2_00080 [Poseidonia sp.]